MGCRRLDCISGHRKGSPNPGTVQPFCFREAIEDVILPENLLAHEAGGRTTQETMQRITLESWVR